MICVKLQTSQRFVSSSNQHPTPASKSPLDILKTKAPLISVYLQWNEEIITFIFSMNECWIFFLSSCEGLKSGNDWLESICQLHIETLSIILAANGPVSSVGGVLRGKKVLNVETRHCLPTCYWQVLCWWRRTGAQCVQHTPDFVNRSKVFVWREAKNGKIEDIQLQILLSRVGNRT